MLERYRTGFRPSRWRARPYVILAVETICADTDAEATALGAPSIAMKASLLTGTSGGELELVTPARAAELRFPPEVVGQLDQRRATQAHGGPDRVIRSLTDLATTTCADELMLVTPVYDAAARTRSYELVVKGLADTDAGRHGVVS